VALARPVLNPSPVAIAGSAPVALLVDNSWATARDWDRRRDAALALIDQADQAGAPVAVAFSVAPANADVEIVSAEQARDAFMAAEPQPLNGDRNAAFARLLAALERLGDNARFGLLAVLDDGLARDGEFDGEALQRLAGADAPVERVLWYVSPIDDLRVIANAGNGAEAFDVTLVQAESGGAEPADIGAFDEKGRQIGETTAGFEDGEIAETGFEAPFELRNDYALLRISGQEHAGAVWLIDENSRRRRVGLVSGETGDQALPLLSPLYYITRALSPFADLVEARTGDLARDIAEIIDKRPSVIVMSDIGTLPDDAVAALSTWVDEGGVLVRFAGPRVAAGSAEDPLLPVTLRIGERALGGALSWTEPQPVDAFPAIGPFAGMPAPKDVSVNRQLLAEPDPDLADHTWATLTDGTPLVTGAARGKGTMVFFHVTAEATWSNLPISGSFVEMLRRVLKLARTSTGLSSGQAEAAALAPLRVLNAAGELAPPPAQVKPLPADKTTPDIDNPPGLYGAADGFVALNLMNADVTLAPLSPPQLSVPVTTASYAPPAESDLRGPLFFVAALLFALDMLAVLWMNGLLRSRPSAAARAPVASTLLIAGLALAMLAVPGSARAQDAQPNDAALIEQASITRLAYVKTGIAATDATTEAGLRGLTVFLRSRTAFEPGDPVGVDPATDELSFFPMLYYAIDASGPMPGDEVIARLDAYMQGGGSILFDTRDQLSSGLDGSGSAENQRLREILDGLNIPPLEPVPGDHVLTKAFYLLNDFPGLHVGGPLWVEALNAQQAADRPVRSGDGVSPILITGNDFAGAWAVDDQLKPLLPMTSVDPMQRMYAFRAGVNIVMYMLTGNYKADQVHVPALLERLGQ
nr:DUF4159 domain-containing protein [Rhizobiaceae bacterium]